MPKLNVEGFGEFDVPEGKRLVLALTEDAGVDQLHACGGNARCTTCRVEFISGEPDKMTQAEKDLLEARGLTTVGSDDDLSEQNRPKNTVRLSCQIVCEHDMNVRAISRLEGSGRADAGGTPDSEMQPQPVQWVSK
ncbi:MAG: 2Fe-2S iron-sulfur cluster-binding protein [Gemmataceae bacterium]